MALNVLAWVLLQGFGSEPRCSRLGVRAWADPRRAAADALPPGSRVPVGRGRGLRARAQLGWLTPLTSMFMHGGWFHIIGNMWFLWIFGNNVEDSMGHVRFVVFYVLCGLAAAARRCSRIPHRVIPMVGASGAIGGVMGAYVVLYPRVHVHMLVCPRLLHDAPSPCRRASCSATGSCCRSSAACDSLGGEGGGVAFWAHVGGFVAGAVLVLLFRNPAPARTAPVPWLAAGSVADAQLAQGQTLAAPAPLVVASADCGGSCREAAALSARSVPSEGATADCRSRARGVAEVSAPQWPARRSAVR